MIWMYRAHLSNLARMSFCATLIAAAVTTAARTGRPLGPLVLWSS